MSDTSTDVTPDETPKRAPPPSDPNGAAETDPARLPDDHPLVKALAAQKDEIKALKAKAARLDEIEDASKTEAQRAAEAQAAAEQRAVQAEARALRREVALEHSLSTADAALLDGITDEDAMRALAARLATATPARPGNTAPIEGSTPKQSLDDDRREFVRNLVAGARH